MKNLSTKQLINIGIFTGLFGSSAATIEAAFAVYWMLNGSVAAAVFTFFLAVICFYFSWKSLAGIAKMAELCGATNEWEKYVSEKKERDIELDTKMLYNHEAALRDFMKRTQFLADVKESLSRHPN